MQLGPDGSCGLWLPPTRSSLPWYRSVEPGMDALLLGRGKHEGKGKKQPHTGAAPGASAKELSLLHRVLFSGLGRHASPALPSSWATFSKKPLGEGEECPPLTHSGFWTPQGHWTPLYSLTDVWRESCNYFPVMTSAVTGHLHAKLQLYRSLRAQKSSPGPGSTSWLPLGPSLPLWDSLCTLSHITTDYIHTLGHVSVTPPD